MAISLIPARRCAPIRLPPLRAGTKMFAHTHHHLEHWQVQLQIQLRLHRHTAVRTLATQKMWQPIEHLAISGASHATSWCHGHHRADLRCCSDQAFRECKHQPPASETSARQSSESGFLLRPPFISAGMAVERAARWATPASAISIPAAGDEQADLGAASVGFQSCRAWSSSNGCRFFCARAQVAWRGVWRGVWRVACGVACS